MRSPAASCPLSSRGRGRKWLTPRWGDFGAMRALPGSWETLAGGGLCPGDGIGVPWGGPRRGAGGFCGMLHHHARPGRRGRPPRGVPGSVADGLRSLEDAAKAGLCDGRVFQGTVPRRRRTPRGSAAAGPPRSALREGGRRRGRGPGGRCGREGASPAAGSDSFRRKWSWLIC